MDECWRRFFPALRSLSGISSASGSSQALLAVAKARGKRLGRQAGVRPKSDRLLPKVVAMRAEGRSYRWIARELGISKNTVADIVQRHRANA
ncbi:helix-turn-helix domain-containing protein [Escherichia coli]|uniref:helix-turn-helix domain-containing protein n=1 Tax=Escherichia coli TaxID=562 RepID=UPI00388EAC98